MSTRRPAQHGGSTHLPWLNSRHTFSFGDYHDPIAWSSPYCACSTTTGSPPAPISGSRPPEHGNHQLCAGRHAYVHVTRGQLMLNGARMASGDGAAAVQEPKLLLATGAEAVLFNLP